MDFMEGAHVFDAEGQEIGQVSRVVLSPDDGKVTHIVIRQGLLFTEDKLISIDYIESASPDSVVLFDIGERLKYLPDFEDLEYVTTDVADDIGLTGARRTYLADVEQNIPDGTVALKQGARVISSDNQHVGNILSVIVDPDSEKATAFVISQGLFFKTQKMVPLSAVTQTLEDEVHVSMSAYDLERLPGSPA